MTIRAGNWKLRYWILAGYAIPVLAILASTVLTAMNLAGVRRHTEQLDTLNQTQNLIGRVYGQAQAVNERVKVHLLSEDPQLLTEISQLRESYLQGLDDLDLLMKQQGREAEAIALRDAIASLRTLNQRLTSQVKAKGLAAVVADLKAGLGRSEVQQQLWQEFEQLLAHNNELVRQETVAQEQALQRLMFMNWSITAAALLFSLITAWHIFQRTAYRMDKSAGAIVQSSAAIGETVVEQEAATQQQASSIQETNVTMHSLNQTSQQSAQQAAIAQAEAEQALQLAERGQAAVERTLAHMADLQTQVAGVTSDIQSLLTQTEQINSISTVVSELANQTNMLALNAAVEAVRAGESGRGFTVVSEEIRLLAERSKASAEQIRKLISEIQKAAKRTADRTLTSHQSVGSGVAIAQETAELFQGVTTAVGTIAVNSQQIAQHVQQQAAAIEQITTAMRDLKSIAQNTVQGMQRVRTGTEQLNVAAIDLQTFV